MVKGAGEAEGLRGSVRAGLPRLEGEFKGIGVHASNGHAATGAGAARCWHHRHSHTARPDQRMGAAVCCIHPGAGTRSARFAARQRCERCDPTPPAGSLASALTARSAACSNACPRAQQGCGTPAWQLTTPQLHMIADNHNRFGFQLLATFENPSRQLASTAIRIKYNGQLFAVTVAHALHLLNKNATFADSRPAAVAPREDPAQHPCDFAAPVFLGSIAGVSATDALKQADANSAFIDIRVPGHSSWLGNRQRAPEQTCSAGQWLSSPAHRRGLG